jgi:Flp pilus assembly pilin Flp
MTTTRGETAMPSPAAVKVFKKLADVKLRRSEEGQDLLEYGLLMALIAIFAIGAVAMLGVTISNVFWNTIAASF